MTRKKSAYEIVKDFIKAKVEDGNYSVASKIPSENEFAKVFGVSRKTVRKAINELNQDGLLKTIKGKGTYVVGLAGEVEIFDYYQSKHRINGSRSISVSDLILRNTGDYFGQLFDSNLNDTMYYFTKVESMDSVPVILEHIYIPKSAVDKLENYDLKVFSTNEIFNYEGIKINNVEQNLKVVRISDRNSKYLDLEKLYSVLYIEKRTYDEQGNCIEYREQYIRGDLVRITNEFSK